MEAIELEIQTFETFLPPSLCMYTSVTRQCDTGCHMRGPIYSLGRFLGHVEMLGIKGASSMHACHVSKAAPAVSTVTWRIPNHHRPTTDLTNRHGKRPGQRPYPWVGGPLWSADLGVAPRPSPSAGCLLG